MKISMQPRASGFSLVEIMVAMVIGLIGILVIFQVFSVSESYRRTATGGGDAQQAGAVALYVLEHEMRQAGWGFNSQNAIGCNVQAYDKTQGVLAAYTLVPLRPRPGAIQVGERLGSRRFLRPVGEPVVEKGGVNELGHRGGLLGRCRRVRRA